MGEFHHSIDEKGRLIVPSRFREALGERFVITKGLENCLFGYPMDEWRGVEAKLAALPFTNADARAFVRFFLSGATECEVDRQGRILVPANLRDYARLEKDVVIIGVGTRLEVWSREGWERYSLDTQMDTAGLAEKIANLGI